MLLTCPYCGFSKTVAPDLVPHGQVKVSCPRCRQDFPLTPTPTTGTVDTLENRQQGEPGEVVSQIPAENLPKAGFWLRLVAALIDMSIVLTLQLVLGAVLGFTGIALLGADDSSTINLFLLMVLFTYVLSFAYYIMFTGYCGQTPGKMALRLKVIRCNGEDIGYGRAAFREIPAKFVARILLCIGYLMIVFDCQKQGLHDHIAQTYVIKL